MHHSLIISKVINDLLENSDVDIYVTGSNSKLMSSEISTYLTGRYVTLPVYTLSLREYLTFKNKDVSQARDVFDEYVQYGGFPIVGISSFDTKMLSAVFENIVYLEMKRKGYDVYIGKNNTKEIDFVAVRRDERIYVQVCVQLPDGSDRETANLMDIRDHYHKYVVCRDTLALGNDNGIEIVHIADFLMRDNW